MEDVPYDIMHKLYRDQCIYSAETDIHFAELSVSETLQFAAKACSKRSASANQNESPDDQTQSSWEAVESTLQLNLVSNTSVGNALHPGISGGEKRRLTLGESFLSNAQVQCWDNSTRGMDSATALTVMRAVRDIATKQNRTAIVSLYQASQAIVDLFDHIILLYEGDQIFFGTSQEAVIYFTNLGFDLPSRTSVADYLTAITHPEEARLLHRAGAENIPQTKEELLRLWKESSAYNDLILRIHQNQFDASHETTSAPQTRRRSRGSACTAPILTQVISCTHRSYRRTLNFISIPVSIIIGNAVLAAIIGGLFLNLDDTAATVTIRSNLLFLSVLLNGFMSGSEVS